MAYQFLHDRRVEFHETDLAGIVHFSNFFRYMESAEHAFFRSLGFSVHPLRGVGGVEQGLDTENEVGWPRVHAEADYRLPLYFEEEFRIELLVERIRDKSLHYAFRFWKNPESDEPKLAANGRLTVVSVQQDAETRRMKAVSVPPAVREVISLAPEELLRESLPR